MFNGIITHNPWSIEELTGIFRKIVDPPVATNTGTGHKYDSLYVRGGTHAFFYMYSRSRTSVFVFSAAISYKHTYATEGERDYW